MNTPSTATACDLPYYSESTPQIGDIRMCEALEARAAQQPAIDQRGMVQAILENRIALAEQCAGNTDIRGITTGKQQRPLAPRKYRERFLEFVMGTAVAADQMGSTTAGAISRRTVLQCADHSRVIGQPR
jgi:hypothetical protein